MGTMEIIVKEFRRHTSHGYGKLYKEISLATLRVSGQELQAVKLKVTRDEKKLHAKKEKYFYLDLIFLIGCLKIYQLR